MYGDLKLIGTCIVICNKLKVCPTFSPSIDLYPIMRVTKVWVDVHAATKIPLVIEELTLKMLVATGDLCLYDLNAVCDETFLQFASICMENNSWKVIEKTLGLKWLFMNTKSKKNRNK
eukprot:838774_1